MDARAPATFLAMTAFAGLDTQNGDEGFVAVGDRSLEWHAWGAPDAARTLVLLHEGLGCVGLWLDFPARLAEATGCRVFAYSRAGYGRSSPISLPRPLDYMTREAQAVLPQVLDATGAQDIVLVGHSDGATIAAIFAGTIPDERVKGVALIAPHFFTEPMGLDAIAKAKTAYETQAFAKNSRAGTSMSIAPSTAGILRGPILSSPSGP